MANLQPSFCQTFIAFRFSLLRGHPVIAVTIRRPSYVCPIGSAAHFSTRQLSEDLNISEHLVAGAANAATATMPPKDTFKTGCPGNRKRLSLRCDSRGPTDVTHHVHIRARKTSRPWHPRTIQGFGGEHVLSSSIWCHQVWRFQVPNCVTLTQ